MIKEPVTHKGRNLTGLMCAMALFAGITAGQGETNAPGADRLSFRNGDLLTGKLLSINSQSGVQWTRPDAIGPINFEPSHVTTIDLGTSAPPIPWSNNTYRVLMSGDDLVEGVVDSCDSNSIHITTAPAGVLTPARGSLVSLTRVLPPDVALFEGPTGMDGWVQGISSLAPLNGTNWTYRNGAFYSDKSASIARDFKLPPVASIQFDLRWQNMFMLALALYADSPQPVNLTAKDKEPAFGAFYSFRLNSSMADMFAVKQGEPERMFDPVIIQAFARTNRAHVDLRVNKPKGSISLLINGMLMKEWIDSAGFAGQGTYLRFVNQGLGSVKISNIRISRWDGTLDQMPPPTNPAEDICRLDDNTFLQGRLISIANGSCTISKAGGITEIPLERLREVNFGRSPARSGTAPANVRVFFGRSGRLAIQLEEFDGTNVHGISANLGKVQVNGPAISRFQMLH